MQEESMWNSTRFIKELKSDFLGVNLVLILVRTRIGLLGDYSRESQPFKDLIFNDQDFS